jgi:hypothetical protein
LQAHRLGHRRSNVLIVLHRACSFAK